MAQLTMEMRDFLEEFPDIETFESRNFAHTAFCGCDSGIVPFSVRNTSGGRMTMPELLAFHEKLAERNILVGPPATIGHRGALRLSLAVGDISTGEIAYKLAKLGDAFVDLGLPRRGAAGAATVPIVPGVREAGALKGFRLQ